MDNLYKLAILGGGASGMAAAIAAGENGVNDIIILEGGQRVGRKIAATGNGQGNIANVKLSTKFYHSGNIELVKKVFEKVSLEKLISFFERTGISLMENEKGRLYPQSLQAASIVDCLRLRCAKLGIIEKCDFLVKSLSIKNNCFEIASTNGDIILAEKAVVACGSSAASHLSAGSGYSLMQSFGHTCTDILPSLVQLKTDNRYKQLKGVRWVAEIKVLAGERVVYSNTGDIIFTEYGISGLAVFECSGYAVRQMQYGKKIQLSIDFLPNISFEKLSDNLEKRKHLICERQVSDFLIGFIHKQIAIAVLKEANIDAAKICRNLTSEEIKLIAQTIKSFRQNVTGNTGLKNAQVSIGGIDANEFDDNLMSKKLKNLYACGEILDVDGDCGGYNLMWAFASGIVAGSGV